MNEKPMYLLAGGRPRDSAGMVRCLSIALESCGVNKPRVAYIGTASGDRLPFFSAIQSMLWDAGAGEVPFPRLAKPDADVQAAKRTLLSADALFLTGGEVEDGINWLRRHNLTGFMKELYHRGKVLIGMSAGSIMMGAHWVRWEREDDDSTASLFDCLHLVPAVFDTHAEDEDWKEIKTALTLMGPGSEGFGIPRGGMISADEHGNLTNIEKTLLHFVNDNGVIQKV